MGRDVNTDECWLYAGYINKDGYGQTTARGVSDNKQYLSLIHRVTFTSVTGVDIPEKMTLDHLCRVRSCINPDHMEIVTFGENVLRGDTEAARNRVKTHCKWGHEFNEANTYYRKDRFQRGCITCRLATNRRLSKRKRG